MEHLSEEDSYTTDFDSGSVQGLQPGDNFGRDRDPEHFPPRNAIQKVGNTVRRIPMFFRGKESQFGLRVAAATMTIAIVCYLRDTQTFFLRQRLRWVRDLTCPFNTLLTVAGDELSRTVYE